MYGSLDNEKELADIYYKVFPQVYSESEIDVRLDTLMELYEKLSYRILEEWNVD